MEKVLETYTTRAVTKAPRRQGEGEYGQEPYHWTAGIDKTCPGCGSKIQRNELMLVEKIEAGTKTAREYDYGKRGYDPGTPRKYPKEEGIKVLGPNRVRTIGRITKQISSRGKSRSINTTCCLVSLLE